MAVDNSRLTLVGVGDLHPNGSDPENYFRQCGHIFRQADIAFGQFEGIISKDNPFEVYSPQSRVGCWQPRIATVLSDTGFKVLSLASNHAMDGGSRGLQDTMELFQSHGIKIIGAGANLDEARSVTVLESKGRRIAFLGSCSVMPVGYEADHDRPGVAPLRATTSYEQVDYQPGTLPLVRTACNPDDLQAIIKSVREARSKADIVVVSFHFGVHFVPEYIAQYQEEAAHAVIDEGADLVLGHHAHILKGIEVYKGKVIFYGLGNFAMDFTNSTVKPAMHWFWEKLRQAVMSGIAYKDYPWFCLNDVDPDGSGHLVNLDARKTMIAKAVIYGNSIERVSFLPAVISRHIPTVLNRPDSRAQEVLDYVKRISRSQCLKATFTWDGDEVVISP